MNPEELKYLTRLETANQKLLSENQRLREALKPFAHWSSAISDEEIKRAKEILDETRI